MALNHALNTYQKTAVETAEPLQLVILCYDAAIRDLKEAKDLHERQEMDEVFRKIRHAQDIITELLVGLDYERGGDIARNLNRIYNYMLRKLIGINCREETAVYDHLVKLLSELKSAWEEIRMNAHEAAPVEPASYARTWQASA